MIDDEDFDKLRVAPKSSVNQDQDDDVDMEATETVSQASKVSTFKKSLFAFENKISSKLKKA